MIRTGSARGKSGQRSRGHHSQHQQQHYQQQQQQQYQYQQQQQQQYHPQSNGGGGGHGYVVSADGYVQHQQQQPQQQQQQQQQVQYNGQGVQYSSNHGVQFNPGGSSTNRMMAGGVNSGYHGSMDSINSNTLSYDSDLSTGMEQMNCNNALILHLYFRKLQHRAAEEELHEEDSGQGQHECAEHGQCWVAEQQEEWSQCHLCYWIRADPGVITCDQ